MVAVEFGEQRGVDGSYTAKAGCAAAVTKAAQKRNMILLTAGEVEMHMLCCLVYQLQCVGHSAALGPSKTSQEVCAFPIIIIPLHF